MKKLTQLLLLLQVSVIFAQVKFDNEKITLVNDIFYNTKKTSIDAFMKEKGFEKGKVLHTNEDNITDIYFYSSKFNDIEIYYTNGNKVFGVGCVYMGAPNNVVIEMELSNKGYTAINEEEEFEGVIVTQKVWSKPNSKLKYVTGTYEELKTGVLAFGYFPKK